MHVGPVGSVHNKAREAATNLMNRNTHIETAVSKHSDQARKAYRTCLNASIKCTKFLLRQGLAFRGHDESATSSNMGNYLELLQFLADNDDKVREVVMENAPGNLKLLAPCIQKEIVNSYALETLDAIMDGLKDKFFSILMDEARDVSVKEQMTMVLRYMDNKGHVIERFVGIQHVTDTTSSSLKDAIDTFFSRNDLCLSKLRGQGYDDASNMRVVHVLQMVIDDNPNENAGEANKLMREIRIFEFVFHLFLMKAILGLTNDLSQALQRKDQEIVNAMTLVKSCKEKLH
ncbi:zinc finger MYM-type protein 1-like [Prunus persica]|uniref:zinc finger MYM-type protein 1-like n=1 Tax=Prunus persica TaxID=3760 RepID=UPI0009AB354D|nr:zinc finger MYM-type protein 1-like [Prunus persica]